MSAEELHQDLKAIAAAPPPSTPPPMTKSHEIHELAAALAKAQGEMAHAQRTADNPFFKSKYATLAAVWDVCREPLTSNGLSVTQIPTVIQGEQILVSMLLHSSGQWLRGFYPIVPVKPDPQGVGSAISYARRYSLMGLVGVCPSEDEDDDGNAASAKKPPAAAAPKPRARKSPPTEKPALKATPKETERAIKNAEDALGPQYHTSLRCTQRQRNMLWAKATEKQEETGVGARQIMHSIFETLGIVEQEDGKHVILQQHVDEIKAAIDSWEPEIPSSGESF